MGSLVMTWIVGTILYDEVVNLVSFVPMLRYLVEIQLLYFFLGFPTNPVMCWMHVTCNIWVPSP